MKSMKDKDMEKLIKSIDNETRPPEGLKEMILSGIMNNTKSLLSPVERFIFEKPLRAALAAGLAVSAALWAAMGNGFADFLSGIIG